MSDPIKFFRSQSGSYDDYGRKFTKYINDAVGGKKEWRTDEWPHGIAVTTDNKVRIKRCEDGPEFYLNFANTFAACSTLLIAAIQLWFSMPKKEKNVGGTRHVEIRTPGLRVRIDCSNTKKAEAQLKKLIKALK